MSDNPLLETKVTSLDDLMSRDPLGLSTEDKMRILTFNREMRARYDAGEKTPKTTAAKPKLMAAPANLSLDDLFGPKK